MLSETQKKQIEYLFWNTSDNSDAAIASKLNISSHSVAKIIQYYLHLKFVKINKRVNENYEKQKIIKKRQLQKSAKNERLLKLVQEENKEFYSADIG